MNCVNVIKDSVETSITMKLFKTKKSSLYAHIFKSKIIKYPISQAKNNLSNFNPERLQKTASKSYPIHNRPRGNKDIHSVNFYRKQIKNNMNITPIWLFRKNKENILLDGAHRIVASYIENKKYIYAYVIEY